VRRAVPRHRARTRAVARVREAGAVEVVLEHERPDARDPVEHRHLDLVDRGAEFADGLGARHDFLQTTIASSTKSPTTTPSATAVRAWCSTAMKNSSIYDSLSGAHRGQYGSLSMSFQSAIWIWRVGGSTTSVGILKRTSFRASTGVAARASQPAHSIRIFTCATAAR
jgi:hypothetical protein